MGYTAACAAVEDQEGEKMLPAKFRGFASRVGRLASRALVWRKTSANDAVRTSSTAVISSTNANTFGTASTSFDNAVTSSSAATSGSVTIARAARPSHTLRRALFAMFVAAATIVTMLIVPPVKEANAANVSWDYTGNGYISPNSVASYDVYRDFGVQPPDINTVTVNGKKTTTITWNVLFNATSCRIKKIANPFLDCDEEAAEHTYGGRPDFYLILPADLKDNTIKITRYRTRSDGRHPVKRQDGGYSFINTYSWETRGENQSPGDFNGGSNETKLPGDKGYDGLWDNSISQCGMGSNNACEINTWRRAGKFGRILKSWEQDNGVDAIRWIVSAEVKDGVNPYDMPFLAGWISLRGDKHKFTAWGPYDHDGDGIPDLEEFKYGLNPKNDDDIQFPKRSKEDAVYGEVTSVKPYINTGEWVGDSYNGNFKYYKDMPNHGGRTTSEMIPTDAGIEFTFKKNEIGNKEILPSGVTKASSPNNMKPGQAYINPRTGEVKYSPKTSDRGKTIHFDVQINYPDPRPNNCKMNNSIVKVKRVDIHVVSQASRYNPEYETLKNVEPTSSNAFTERPKSVRPNGKYWVKEGPLPEGTTFTLRQYKGNGGKGGNIGDPVLKWSHIENEDKKTGRVHFKPGRKEAGLKGKTPVIVTYPDGSTSEDSDAANFNGGKGVVYASVEVNKLPVGDQDMHLNIHNGNNEYSLAGAPIRDSDILHYTNSMPIKPNLVLDSWSNVQPGKIVFRTLCSEDSTANRKYTFLSNENQEFNGLKIGKPVQWEKLNIAKKNCKDKQCDAKKYLYTDDSDTAERSRAVISGTPKNNGNFTCVVFALHAGSDILNNLDKLAKNHPEQLAMFTSLTSKDIASRTFRFQVHPMAEMYNPKYETSTVQAGNFDKNNNVSKVPRSFRNANGVTNNPSYVKNNAPLPDGTWFEPSNLNNKLSKWASFEDGQDNKPANNNNVGNHHNDGDGAKYGKVTFSPDKWQEADTYNYPVVVHYPDGSKSTDRGSANGGKPVNAPVNVERQTANPDFHLNLYTGRTGGTIIIDNDPQGVTFKKNQNVDMLVDSWSTYKPGPIDQRVICYKKDPKTDQPIAGSYQVGGINGLSLTGDSNGKPKQWQHADVKKHSEKRQKCNRNDRSGCETGTYLYDYDVKDGVDGNRETTERTKGRITGNPKDYGDFVCTVYGLKTLSHKGNNGSLVSRFDTFVKNIKTDTSGTLSNINELLNNKVDTKNPQNNSVRHIDWESVTFPIHVHPDAYYYNPVYDLSKVIAGNKVTSNSPTSVKPGSGTTDNIYIQKDAYDAIKEGALPPGTWYELKKYSKPDRSKTKYGKDSLEWTKWDPATNSNEPDNKNDPNNHIGKHHDTGDGAIYGKVTFRPDKWQDAATYYQPVVVHYPDGSTSEDAEAGNNQFSKTQNAKDTFNPVYAPVAVGREDDKNTLNLNLYKHYYDKGMGNGYDLKVGESLTNDATFDSWMTKSVGKLHQHVICSKKGTDGKYSEYTYNALPGHFDKKGKNAKDDEKDGLRFKSQKIWDHASFKQQEQCRADSKKCDKNNYLYDSDGASEQTRGYFGGKAQKTGDYQCKVYVISGDKKSTEFENAVKAKLKKDTSADPAVGMFDKTKDNKYPYGEDGKGYKTDSFEVRIHNDAHFYNPVYENVNVQAGGSVETAVPSSKKPVAPANDPNKYDYIKEGSFPDGTWFEFKTEKGKDGVTRELQPEWAYWGTDNNEDQSNKPDNLADPNNHKGKHSEKGDGAKYGKITFNPDLSIKANSYKKYVVVHYPDGSTSDDPDAGNNQFKASSSATSTMNPVFAPVKVTKNNNNNDLQMELLRSEDADPQHDSLSTSNPLTVMSGTSLTKNPYVRAWSVTNKNPITFRMLCTKDGQQKWSRGLDDSLNMHLDDKKGGYGEFVEPWPFATREQRIACSMNDQNCYSNLLYGFTKGTGPLDKVSAVARSEVEISGIPQQAGTYTCSVYALKGDRVENVGNTDKKHVLGGNLDKFQEIYDHADKTNDGKYITGIDWSTLQPSQGVFGKKQMGAFGNNWQRITFKVNVIDPPKFALPKTGGMNWNVLLGAFAVIGTGVMAAGFFLEQTKWGRAMLDALLRKTLIKDFICKTAKKLRALRRRSERWRC